MANLTLNREDRTRTWGLILAGLIIFAGAPFMFNVGGSLNCINPPRGNPNQCHIYTWSDIPQDTSFVPKTGMFNNDTSYYFNTNSTLAAFGVTFQICAQIITSASFSGNASLTLQYWTGGSWNDFDGGPLGTGGLGGGSLSLSWPGFGLPLGECSTNSLTDVASVGAWSPANVGCVTFTQGDNNGCSMRIAGNEPITSCGCKDSATFANLSVVFFYGAIANPIVCRTNTKSATNFVAGCTRIFATTIANAVSMAWSATNETSTVEGVWKFGTATCSIPQNGVSCSVTTTFSPAFKAGSTVTVNFAQNPLASGGVISLQTTYNILT